MQGRAEGRRTDLGWPEVGMTHPSVPPCGDTEGCACFPDKRVTVADMERLARELGMPLSELVA